jgi:hypothetical protein
MSFRDIRNLSRSSPIVVSVNTGCTKTNYARLGHASQSLIPKLLQQLLLFYEPTNTITDDCLNNSYLNKKLNAIEWLNIRKANTDDYADFDIPLIYKLLRNLKLIPAHKIEAIAAITLVSNFEMHGLDEHS